MWRRTSRGCSGAVVGQEASCKFAEGSSRPQRPWRAARSIPSSEMECRWPRLSPASSMGIPKCPSGPPPGGPHVGLTEEQQQKENVRLSFWRSFKKNPKMTSTHPARIPWEKNHM